MDVFSTAVDPFHVMRKPPVKIEIVCDVVINSM
jgi:hypothetical protein